MKYAICVLKFASIGILIEVCRYGVLLVVWCKTLTLTFQRRWVSRLRSRTIVRVITSLTLCPGDWWTKSDRSWSWKKKSMWPCGTWHCTQSLSSVSCSWLTDIAPFASHWWCSSLWRTRLLTPDIPPSTHRDQVIPQTFLNFKMWVGRQKSTWNYCVNMQIIACGFITSELTRIIQYIIWAVVWACQIHILIKDLKNNTE